MKRTVLAACATWPRAGVWLLCLLLSLGTCWRALAQATSPLAVRMTVSGVLLNGPTPPVLTAQAVSLPLPVAAGFNGPVYAVVVQPNGSLVVGGSFTTYKGVTCNKIARLSPDGVLDAAFAANTGSGAMLAGGVPGAAVRALALLSNGQLLAGGDFAQYAGLLRSYLVRLHATGALDTGYGNVSGLQNTLGGTTTTAVAAGVHVLAIQVVQGQEKVLVGGNFTNYSFGGTSTPVTLANLARLNGNGTLDTIGFTTNGFDAPVFALLVQPAGIVVGGAFQNTLAAGTGSVPQNRVSRLTLAGAYNAFSSPVNFAYGSVKTLAAQTNGDVIVGGDFYVGAGTNPGIARMKAGTGALDPTFPGTALSALAGVGASVNVVVAQAGDTLLVGGNFVSSSIGYNHLIQLTGAGAPTGFATTSGGNSSFGTTVAQGINALAVQPDGKVVAGGDFLAYNGTPSQRLARLTRTATLDLAPTPLSATYAWSNGSTGPSLTAVATRTYSVTATVRGQLAMSAPVKVTRPADSTTFNVRVTPAGPMRLCPGTKQRLTALAVNVPTGTPPGAITYRWWQVQGSTLTLLRMADTCTVFARTAGTQNYYVATVDISGASAASPTLAVQAMPEPTVYISLNVPHIGVPGTQVNLEGTDLDQVTNVYFGTTAASFTRQSATRVTVTVPAITYYGPITVATPCTTADTFNDYQVAPSITSFTPAFGAAGTVVTVTGSGFTPTMSVELMKADFTYVGLASTEFTYVSGTEFTVTIPTRAATNTPTLRFLVHASGSEATSANAFAVTSGAVTTISTTTSITQTTPYTNLVIRGQGNVTLTHDISIISNVIVQNGATLNTGAYKVTGSGNFVLEDGGTLLTSDAQGINIGGATGAIQLTGDRRYSDDASYGYTGTAVQATGDGLPSQVRNLRCANTTDLTLTSPVAVAQLLTMASTGNLLLNGNMLTLLSGPRGTALVYNQGTGVVVGAATAQRYIDPSVNPTAGFRYYGAPVRGATALQLPAPVFAFDEARITANGRRDTTAAINYGFVPGPLQPNTGLEAGRGYRAAVPAATTVGFVGTLTTDTLSLRLVRSLPASYSGWNLVSNPYPSPLDWSLVLPADRPGLDAAIYVYESTGPGTGYFRSYVNGAGTGSPLIAAGQAFFVRVSGTTPGGTGRLRFRNSQRVTVFDNAIQPIFNRTALTGTIPELVLELARNGSRCPCGRTSATHTPVPAELNSVTVYTDLAATAGFDRLLDADAGNLFSPAQQTLGMRSSGPDTLAVQALPTFSATSTRRVPLTLTATAPGDYAFSTTAVALPTLLNGASGYLRDSSATTNRWLPLPLATPYTFTLSAAELLTRVRPVRFYLYFGPVVALGSTASTALQSAIVYPNPTHGQVGVQVPGVPGATQVQATLLTTLGQVVLRQEAALPTMGTTLSLRVPGLSSGVYILRLRAGDTTTTRRVVLE